MYLSHIDRVLFTHRMHVALSLRVRTSRCTPLPCFLIAYMYTFTPSFSRKWQTAAQCTSMIPTASPCSPLSRPPQVPQVARARAFQWPSLSRNHMLVAHRRTYPSRRITGLIQQIEFKYKSPSKAAAREARTCGTYLHMHMLCI